MAVLADEKDPAGVIDGEHGHSAWVLNDVAFGFLAVWHPHGVPPDRHDAALGDHVGGCHRPAPGQVGQPLCAGGAGHALAIERPPPTAATDWLCDRDLERSSAAAIRPLNSGCGLVGRDRNSGCAWVAAKNGCSDSGISTNSTSRPSGDRPEQISPAASSVAR